MIREVQAQTGTAAQIKGVGKGFGKIASGTTDFMKGVGYVTRDGAGLAGAFTLHLPLVSWPYAALGAVRDKASGNDFSDSFEQRLNEYYATLANNKFLRFAAGAEAIALTFLYNNWDKIF